MEDFPPHNHTFFSPFAGGGIIVQNTLLFDMNLFFLIKWVNLRLFILFPFKCYLS